MKIELESHTNRVQPMMSESDVELTEADLYRIVGGRAKEDEEPVGEE